MQYGFSGHFAPCDVAQDAQHSTTATATAIQFMPEKQYTTSQLPVRDAEFLIIQPASSRSLRAVTSAALLEIFSTARSVFPALGFRLRIAEWAVLAWWEDARLEHECVEPAIQLLRGPPAAKQNSSVGFVLHFLGVILAGQ